LYNDDATGLADAIPGRARESLVELIDRVTDNVPVDVYALECALPDLCEYDSKVGEVRGARFSQPPDARSAGIAALREEGEDLLSVYTETLHAKGIPCVAEVRLSDTHHRKLDLSNPICPRFAVENPQWCIVRPDGMEEVALDYSFPEVRAHRLAIMTELATERGVDGLELNFIRWGKHFHRDQGREKAPIMTAFVGEIRDLLRRAAERRGRDRLLLGVRMPSTIEACWLAGCDPETWVRNGWIDYLVVAEHNCTWPGTRVDEFVPFCRGRCELYVQMGDMMGGVWQGKPRIVGRGVAQFAEGYWGMLLSNEEARGAAANFFAWGADGVAFWNISCNIGNQGKWHSPEQRARTLGWMNEVIRPERVTTRPRTYHYLPLYKGIHIPERNYAYRENLCSPLGERKGQILEFPAAEVGQRKTFEFRLADGRDGSKVAGRLRFRVLHCDADSRVRVDVNGAVLDQGKVKRALDPDNQDISAWWFAIDLADCPPLRGDNELGLTWLEAPGAAVPCVEELEITVS